MPSLVHSRDFRATLKINNVVPGASICGFSYGAGEIARTCQATFSCAVVVSVCCVADRCTGLKYLGFPTQKLCVFGSVFTCKFQ